MKKPINKGIITTIILILIMISLAVVPLFFNKIGDFQGSDDRAAKAISELNNNYKPWFKSFWKPSSEITTFFFVLQGALGGGFVGYYIGFVIGKSKGKSEK